MNWITYYYRGPIERGGPDSQGRPSYHWTAGYSENSSNGAETFPWMTKTECRADAKARGSRAKFEGAKSHAR